MWEPHSANLALNYHCLVPDLPEQGKSWQVSPFTISDAAHRIAELIRTRAHNGKAHVVGLSLGAQTLVELLVNDIRSKQVLPSDISTCPPM